MHVMKILSLVAEYLATALEKLERFPRDFDYNAIFEDPAPWIVRIGMDRRRYRICGAMVGAVTPLPQPVR